MLFQAIPDTFFSILASPNKKLYWECIFKLFTITSTQLSFGMNRDDAADELAYYLESDLSIEFQEENDESLENIKASGSASRERAGAILRTLEKSGWINAEVNNSNEKKIFFTDYAIEIIKTLVKVAKKERVEYQGYIYTIYNLARGSNENPGLALDQIYENTDKLITGLKNLNSNIKRYIDNLTKHSTVSEIMENLLVDYKGEIIDKAFHRLMTADNVSKFRPEIVARLEAKKDDELYIERAAREFSEIKELELTEARELVFDMLSSIIDAFHNMDDILSEIISRSTKYQKAAVNRAKFILTAKDDTQGQLREILSFLNEEVVKAEMDLHAIYEIEFIDEMIRLFKSEVIDQQSFYTPIEGRSEFVPEELSGTLMSKSEKRSNFARLAGRLAHVMSAGKIESFVDEILGERQSAEAKDFPKDTADNFVKLIYIRLYGQRKRLNFYVVPKDDFIEDDDVKFRNFEIHRRNKGK